MTGTADEAAVRRRLSDIADTCAGCRRCTDLCPVFPTLFDLLDGRDAGSMTPDEQDRVIDGCWQCGRCLDGCPYGPGAHDVAVDVAAAVRDVRSVVVGSGRAPVRGRLGDRLLGRPDLVGRLATGPIAPLARTLLRPLAAVGRVRLELPMRQERFTSWWARRGSTVAPGRSSDRPDVVILPTCLVEYRAPEVGRALVEVFERAGLSVGVSSAGCCGAPWLQSGDLDRFGATARRTLTRLAAELGDQTVVVVPQSSCAQALVRTAPEVIDDPAAHAGGVRVRDPIEHLLDHLRRHGVPDIPPGDRPVRVVHHVSCRSSDGGEAVAELLGLLGAEVELVRQCSGVGDTWGARRARDEQVDTAVGALSDRFGQTGAGPAEVLTTECDHTAAALARTTGRQARHPLEIVARMFGV